MTVTYSLDVAKATFGGFTKLLLRWRGSIYKILWKEFLVFCLAYAAISLIYRCCLDAPQKELFERIVIYVETFSDLIPLSFVLGFYVSMVAGRWVNMYNVLPWTDKVAFMIASYVHGSDHRSRMIRRTLGRYLILIQVLTFQLVSTSVKRRFPTTQHLVDAGIMTRAEYSVYEKVDFPYGKWWLPCHWFTALATRAKKEGRIKDSLLLNALMQEMMKVRDNCAIMIGFDWITVPLVYTQVVTIATYLYAISLLIGRQYLDPAKGYNRYPVDLYVPLFTLLQFFFYVGWLKVAEQILNPYGEDDDDYELNWLLDRTVNKVYLTVDALHMKHPKVTEDAFWDETLIHLPQTKFSARFLKNPDLGSAHGLNVEEAEYVPLDELCEQDLEENKYRSESVKKKEAGRQNSSFIRRVLGSGFTKSGKRAAGRSHSCKQGVSNPAFCMADDDDDAGSARSSPGAGRKTSLRNLVRKISPSNKRPSVKFRSNSTVKKKQKSYEVSSDKVHFENTYGTYFTQSEDTSAKSVGSHVQDVQTNQRRNSEDDFEHAPAVPMPSIPEEAPRGGDSARASRQVDRVHKLVRQASEALLELSKSVSAPVRLEEGDEGRGYESCCSRVSSKESEGDSEDEAGTPKVEDISVEVECDQQAILPKDNINCVSDQSQQMATPLEGDRQAIQLDASCV